VSIIGGAWSARFKTGISSWLLLLGVGGRIGMSCSDLAGEEQAPDSIPESPLGLSRALGNLYGQVLVLSLLEL
jgi:hypothetical protein